jgi:hypothetical protein
MGERPGANKGEKALPTDLVKVLAAALPMPNMLAASC